MSADLVAVVPSVWSSWPAFIAAAVPFACLLAVELRTSRVVQPADRAAHRPAERDADHVVDGVDHEVDTATGWVFDGAVAVAMTIGVVASLALRGLTIAPPMASLGLGIGLMIAALALSAAARRHLGRFHRHVLTSHHDHELVATGPYRYVRHPIYSATAIAFLGIGAALGNWVSLVVLAVLPTGALVHRIRVEEAILLGRLGSTYERYCAGRARLVPGLW